MFENRPLKVGDWWLFYILMIIPFVNIIVFLMILLGSKGNQCLKSYLWASILPVLIIIVLFFVLGFGAVLSEGL